jgi:hypothetical protein
MLPGMPVSDSTDLFELCEKITSQFLPDELSDFKNEGMLRIEHSLKYPKAYSAQSTFGVPDDSSSSIETDEFAASDIQIWEESLKCIPLIVAAVKAVIDFRNQAMISKSKQEQIVVLKREWVNYLNRFHFPAEATKAITDHYAEDLARIAAK